MKDSVIKNKIKNLENRIQTLENEVLILKHPTIHTPQGTKKGGAGSEPVARTLSNPTSGDTNAKIGKKATHLREVPPVADTQVPVGN